ncbi:MAG: hypothetical protein EBT60_07865 [Bacteroidetes bacterium]|nr:hypothetical protein [Bacteroidota bacterium]
MKITIEFDTDNAAFEDDRINEVNYILKQVTERVTDSMDWDDSPIRTAISDSNGNRIGTVVIKH